PPSDHKPSFTVCLPASGTRLDYALPPLGPAPISVAVSEVADPRYVGTALTVQTSLGFLLTTVTLRVIPPLRDLLGWERAFALLALGPVFGIWSMLRLRRLPEAKQMAGGRR